MQSLKTILSIEKTAMLPLGLHMQENSVRFALRMKKVSEVKLNIYKKGKDSPDITIIMDEQSGFKWGEIFSVSISAPGIASLLTNEYEYTYECDQKEFIDAYALSVTHRNVWGKRTDERERAGFFYADMTWAPSPNISFDQSIFYQLHVRGFTKHFSSDVEGKGTFVGLTHKLSYLKELGVNSLLLLPCYDFNEINMGRLNYWGYVREDNYYFAPKSSYASKPTHANEEFAHMINEAHKQGLQIIMDMHFAHQSQDFIVDCLRYYVLTFHVDGFLLNLDAVMKELIWDDPVLSQVKLLGTYWDGCEKTADLRERHLCEYNDGFMEVARQFLKGDEGKATDFYQLFKANAMNSARINYITQVNGFTLNDLVSYDIKHNEPNGENNRDGTDFNYSWNCGTEGLTKRKNVLSMREQQRKNALVMVFLGMGTPMIFMGDEFGNSQKGDNNAYCVDTPLTWLNWSNLASHEHVHDFIQTLIEFRKTLNIYHQQKEFVGSDYMAYGYPDVSLHGTEPWASTYPHYCREIGVLFSGKYCDGNKTPSIYIAFNMHWEPHEFYLPALEKDEYWTVFIDTVVNEKSQQTKREKFLSDQTKYKLDARSVVVFVQK